MIENQSTKAMSKQTLTVLVKEGQGLGDLQQIGRTLRDVEVVNISQSAENFPRACKHKETLSNIERGPTSPFMLIHMVQRMTFCTNFKDAFI